VWRARHVEQSVDVAVKVLHRDAIYDAHRIGSFRKEVRNIARLRHPGIVMVLDYGEVGLETERSSKGKLVEGAPYLVMELASGGSLDQIHRQMSWNEARATLLSLLDALSFAHANGVIHRDIKLGNVLLCTRQDARPGLKLTDFGIAHAILDVTEQHTLDEEDLIAGTLHYMSPEQLMGHWRDFGPWTDLYAVGCLAWRLLAGTFPFSGKNGGDLVRAHVLEAPPEFKPAIEVPDAVRGWLLDLLQKSRFLRFQRAADARWALEQMPENEAGGREATTVVSTSDDVTLLRTTADPLADTIELSLSLTEPMSMSATKQAPRTHSGQATPPPAPVRISWRRPRLPPEPPELVDAGLGLYGLRAVPIVGRAEERDDLWAALRDVAAQRRPQVVLVRGPAGIGTSRLGQWTCERAEELGAASSMRCHFGLREAGTEGIRRMVEYALGTINFDAFYAAERIGEWIEEQGEPMPGEVNGLVRLLRPQAALVGQSTPRERYTVVYRLLRRLSSTRPVVLFMDDIHYGADGVAFVRHLLASSPLPVLVVCTVTDELLAGRAESELVDWLAEQGKTLSLGPLTGAECQELTRSLLALDRDLAADLEERSSGNPSYIVDVIGDWVARGFLRLSRGRFQLTGSGWTLPDDLHERWQGRLDLALRGLPTQAKESLWRAAVLGSHVIGSEWRAITPEMDLGLRMTVLERLFTGRLAHDGGDDGFRFGQAGLRDSLLRQAETAGASARIHEECVAMLRRRAGESGIAERLGIHLRAAGHLEECVVYLLDGVLEVEKTAGVRPAIALLGVAFQVIGELNLEQADERWVRATMARGRLLEADGERALAGQHFETVRRLAKVHGFRRLHADACFFLDLSAQRMNQALDRKGLLKEWRVAVTSWGDPLALGKFHYSCGTHRNARYESRDRQRHHLAMALRYFKECDEKRGVAFTLRNLAMDASTAGDDDRAVALHERAMEIFGRLGLRGEMALCTNGLAESWRRQGQLDRAEAAYRESLHEYQSLGYSEAIYPRLNLGIVAVMRGEWETAERQLEAGRRMASRMSWHQLELVAHIGLLAPAAARGDKAGWDGHFAAVDHLEVRDELDPDLADLLEIAAGLARTSEWLERSKAALEAALRQWEGLARGDEAARVRTALLAMG
jgi:eukaryotic-like serine/threonine-protein kinase